MLKIAVFAPTPSATVMTATNVNARCRARNRTAYRRSSIIGYSTLSAIIGSTRAARRAGM